MRESQEGLNDTYYSHAKDQQGQALDDEMESYQDVKDKYLENLRETLENTDLLINEKISEFLLNADIGLNTLNDISATYGVTLSQELRSPWESAQTQSVTFQDAVVGVVGAVQTVVQNSTSPLTASINLPWNNATKADGPLSTFSKNVNDAMNDAIGKAQNSVETMKDSLSEPWLNATSAAKTFGQNSLNVMDKVIDKAEEAYAAISKLANAETPSYTGNGAANQVVAGAVQGIQTVQSVAPIVKTAYLSTPLGLFTGTGRGATTTAAQKAAKDAVIQQTYEAYKKLGHGDSALEKFNKQWEKNVVYAKPKSTPPASTSNSRQNLMYAKGTLGTKRDEWAITDEPQFGDELVLVPGKNGNLSFMRKGTGVVPADLTQKIFELAQIPTSDLMNKQITAIVPDITKTSIKNEFVFDSLVHVDHCDQSTLKELEKMVDNKINQFGKQMNYSLKKFAR